ncbi:MAG: hypothetical protein J5651_09535, partial [Salinivirgaceae bacterium]|nr:hypothetical protein [Salinivirgaceae bacterium]MBO7432155.1 hypothetical protein [Salinivirgaceae bacterium]
MKKIILMLAVLAGAAGMVNAQDNSQKINKKNLVIKEWNTDVKTNAQILDHTTTYNPEGKKIEEVEYSPAGVKWRKRFEYNAAGKVSKELVYDKNNRLMTYKTFEYNEFGRKKTQCTYDAKGKLLVTKIFEYIAEDV